MIFDKPYNSVAEQLARLEEKAMVIDVLREEAERVIESITYYRFSGYALPFLDRTTDCYTGSLKFSDVLALYRFDSELRSKMISALCAVEVTLRTIVSNEFSAVHGPLGYLDAKILLCRMNMPV